MSTEHTKNSRKALFGLTLQDYAKDKEKRPTIPALTSLQPAALLISTIETQTIQEDNSCQHYCFLPMYTLPGKLLHAKIIPQ